MVIPMMCCHVSVMSARYEQSGIVVAVYAQHVPESRNHGVREHSRYPTHIKVCREMHRIDQYSHTNKHICTPTRYRDSSFTDRCKSDSSRQHARYSDIVRVCETGRVVTNRVASHKQRIDVMRVVVGVDSHRRQWICVHQCYQVRDISI